MRPRKAFPKGSINKIEKLLQRAKTIEEFKRIQSVWLRAKLNFPIEQISQAVGLSIASIRCYHSRYLQEGKSALSSKKRGGRYRDNFSIEEEKELLAPFIEKAQEGRMLVVSEVKAVYEERLGASVAASTIYRMLARHGWRKLLPRKRHPKQDPEKQKRFKKT